VRVELAVVRGGRGVVRGVAAGDRAIGIVRWTRIWVRIAVVVGVRAWGEAERARGVIGVWGVVMEF
jgi:hypothetical protein